MSELPVLNATYSPNLGCDPEFFLRRNGEIIGAEKVIPKAGLPYADRGKLIIDGVQVELNPSPSSCREVLANNIAYGFIELHKELAKQKNKGITVDFSRTVEVSKTELDTLHDDNKVLGCSPSNTAYNIPDKLKVTDVNPSEYLTRSAGGHLHFSFVKKQDGTYSPAVLGLCMDTEHQKTVEMLDIICGNTCVLLDRDEGNIERRKVYGRAGEYRLPQHGLEYRTLSNFWLGNYQLLSFAFGMARLAIHLMADTKHRDKYYKAFTRAVDADKIQEAINNNDFDLAMRNFKAIEKLLLEVGFPYSGRYPICSNNIKEFHYFVDKIKSEGLSYWFKDDPMTYWLKHRTLDPDQRLGFYDYTLAIVKKDRLRPEKQAAEVKVEVPVVTANKVKKVVAVAPQSVTKGKLIIDFA